MEDDRDDFMRVKNCMALVGKRVAFGCSFCYSEKREDSRTWACAARYWIGGNEKMKMASSTCYKLTHILSYN